MTAEELKRINDQLYGVANRGLVAGVLGTPVDMVSSGMSLLGYKHPEPVGGSEWIGNRLSLLSAPVDRNQKAEHLLSLFATPPLDRF